MILFSLDFRESRLYDILYKKSEIPKFYKLCVLNREKELFYR